MMGNVASAKKNEELDDDLYDDDEDTQKDKYLTFLLGHEDYAIEIEYVTEIVGIQKITAVPDMPEYIKGVINLRGQVIPIMDVRRRFMMEERSYNDRTCIIVINLMGTTIGLVVDEVREVMDIPEAQVEQSPSSGGKARSRYIQGIGKIGEEIKIVLDVGALLQEEEMLQSGMIAAA